MPCLVSVPRPGWLRTLSPLVVIALIGVTGCAPTEEASPGADGAVPASAHFDDPEVQRIHDRMMAATDPEGGWGASRFLRFDWIVQRAGGEPVRRSHAWDRWEGRARVEADTDDGRMVAVFDTDAPEEGSVWMDGQPVDGESAAPLLNRAHGMHINDSYWLIMPFKWADPGVTTRALDPEADDEGVTWEVVELSFSGVGLTPDNVYRAYIHPETGRMERWAHYRTADADPFVADWTDFQDVGQGVVMALDKPWVDGGRLWFEHVELLPDVPPDAVDPPGS